MKKILAPVLAAVLATTSVYAENITGQSTDVNYRVDNNWIVTIPSSIDLQNEGGTIEIKATSMNIAPDKQLEVTVTEGIADKKMTLKHEVDPTKSVTTSLALSEGGEAVDTDVIAAIFQGQSTDPVSGGKLYFTSVESDQEVVLSGVYKGTLTFTIEVKDKE